MKTFFLRCSELITSIIIRLNYTLINRFAMLFFQYLNFQFEVKKLSKYNLTLYSKLTLQSGSPHIYISRSVDNIPT